MLLRVIFIAISVLGLSAALATVLARNLVRAALALMGFFFVIACLFLLLEAEFLAAVQILVYIGAVSVLILFGIMLTRNIQGDETTRSRTGTRFLAGLGALGLLFALILAIRHEPGRAGEPGWTALTSTPPIPAPEADPVADDPRSQFSLTRTLGIELLTRYVIAFEMAGLLLTIAVVGAVALAIHEPEVVDPESAALPSNPTVPGTVLGPQPATLGPPPADAETSSQPLASQQV